MIRLRGVGKRFPDGTVAVDELDLDVARGELVCLIGPSGCGKTTTLKMLNRLIEPTSGRIAINGEDVTDVDPVQLRRRIGYVIQNVGLFPHQSVLDNVGTVPRLLGWDKARVRARSEELLELVGLPASTFAARYPSQLSGGQRQRVGVARALGADPPVLLMDEPFSAIDPIARDRLQLEFLRIQAEVRKTVVFVTHDIDEAIRMSDRIAIFRQGGLLEQYDTPAVVLGLPATPFVANFVGADRGLRRLSVTPIDANELEFPPVVAPVTTLRAAGRALAAEGARWGVVLADGMLRGWIGADETEGDGQVADRTHRMEAWVPAGASLKDAYAEMLQYDAAWVAVLDGERYLGVLTPASLHAALRRSVEADSGEPAEPAAGPVRLPVGAPAAP